MFLTGRCGTIVRPGCVGLLPLWREQIYTPLVAVRRG